MIGLFIFIIGACLGSFANVCMYRLPRGKSIVTPGSFCPKCKKPIKSYDNIPVIGYIMLRGKCRNCRKKISVRYPVVEFLTGLIAFLLYLKFSISFNFLIYFVFSLALIIISFIDWDTYLIPDILDIPGIGLGLLCAALYGSMFLDNFSRLDCFLYSLEGAAVGALVIGFLAVLGKLVWKKDAMGGGDLKLLAMIGAFLGWKGVLVTIFFGSLVGTLMSIALILLKKKTWQDYVPFGPYLSLGAIITIFFKGLLFLGFLIP